MSTNSTHIAYRNGEWIPADTLSVSAYDAGFMQGLTVAEQLRTFDGCLFRLDEHLDRLERSLKIVGVDPGMSRGDWTQLAEELVSRNRNQIEAADDLAVAIWVTPGAYPKYADFASTRPLVGGSAFPIDFVNFHRLYHIGQRLVTAKTRQVSPQNWPVELKCRSRMHYFLADNEARETDSSARALLLDLDGFVCEASTANVIAYFSQEGLVAPRLEKTLPGISLGAIDDLARQLELPFHYRDMTVEEFAQADEIILCSTSPCVWPVTQLDGKPVGDGHPGLIFQRLMGAWSELVGVDVLAQAERYANR